MVKIKEKLIKIISSLIDIKLKWFEIIMLKDINNIGQMSIMAKIIEPKSTKVLYHNYKLN